MKHVLEECNSLEANGFTTGIGAADYEYSSPYPPLLSSVLQVEGEGHKCAVLLQETEVKNGVTRFAQIDKRIRHYLRREGLKRTRQKGFGMEKINLSKVMLRTADDGRMWTKGSSKCLQDARSFAFLISL